MPPRGPMGAAFAKNRPKPKDQGKTIKRLLSYIDTPNKVRLAVVFLCIIVSAIAGVLGSMFLEILIDDYITPLLGESNPVFTGLLQAIGTMGLIYLLGAAATFTYNWLMATVSQGILKDIRNDLFSHMQRLPIKYFDTHTHGDIMSRYTNDTDTLRMLVSQSIPQLFNTVITLTAVFVAMVTTSLALTALMLALVAFMLFLTKKIGENSGKYFARQQKSLGAINGYIEEMVTGQKVIKVFCHEEKAKEGFDELNNTLREEASRANAFANIMGPVMNILGNLQ